MTSDCVSTPPNTESEKLILTFSIENFSVLVKIREEQTVD